jgi:hypothetical protein
VWWPDGGPNVLAMFVGLVPDLVPHRSLSRTSSDDHERLDEPGGQDDLGDSGERA